MNGHLFTVFAPERPAAVPLLARLQLVEIRPGRRSPPGPRASGRSLRLERGEHVAERRDGDDARCDLLVALERVAHEIEHGVGQRLEGRRRRGHLQTAELLDHAAGHLHRLGDRAAVDDAVSGKSLRRRRRPHWQLDGARVREFAGHRTDLESRLPGPVGCRQEAHFHAIARGHGHALAGRLRRCSAFERARRRKRDARDRLVRLILHDDRKLEAVTEVEKARRRRAHHEGQARGDRGLLRPELVLAGGGDGHHAVARQAVGELHGAPRCGRARRSRFVGSKTASGLKSVRTAMGVVRVWPTCPRPFRACRSSGSSVPARATARQRVAGRRRWPLVAEKPRMRPWPPSPAVPPWRLRRPCAVPRPAAASRPWAWRASTADRVVATLTPGSRVV